jgi:cation transport ATPase
MRSPMSGLDWKLYVEALPLYARNLGVLLYPLIAAAIALGINFLGHWVSAPTGFALVSIFLYIALIIEGYGFALAIVFADDAWRHQRANLRNAWEQGRRRAGDIIITIIGFFFIVWVAGVVGGILPIPYLSLALQVVAVWAFLYAIPATAIGGVPAGAAFSASLQAARRHPVATAVLAIVSYGVWVGLTHYALNAISPYTGEAAYAAAQVLLAAIALGYIALVVARQYADLAFRFW